MSSDINAAMQLVRIAAENPEATFESLLQKYASEIGNEILFAIDFKFCEYWTVEKNSVALTALFYVKKVPVQNDAQAISIAVLRTEKFDACEKKWRNDSALLNDLLRALPVTIFSLTNAIPLQPISIPKPWGREIWYTGIEKRGVAEVGAVGCSVPLPWLLAAAPQRLTREAAQPILLKILDPLPEPVFGDLYFELHREKQEVYVVTAIDRSAWPDGVGAIRFGFAAKRRKEFADDAAFLEAYLSAVRDYQKMRQRIDAKIDVLRVRDGVGLNAPATAETLARWFDEIEPALRNEEVELRTRMETFSTLMPLRIGDVVKVPCLLPHSLQHGVRTVEFQTPVYERLILSFAQKVLTQSDWDTEEAVRVLQLDPEPPAAFPLLAQGDDWKEEQIVRFDDFEVRRITLQPDAEFLLEHSHSYGLGMVVGQALTLDGNCLNPDDAVLLPARFHPSPLHNRNKEIAYFLLALPLE